LSLLAAVLFSSNLFCSAALLAGDADPAPLRIEKPLIAYWTFDHPQGTLCRRDCETAGHRSYPTPFLCHPSPGSRG